MVTVTDWVEQKVSVYSKQVNSICRGGVEKFWKRRVRMTTEQGSWTERHMPVHFVVVPIGDLIIYFLYYL